MSETLLPPPADSSEEEATQLAGSEASDQCAQPTGCISPFPERWPTAEQRAAHKEWQLEVVRRMRLASKIDPNLGVFPPPPQPKECAKK